MPRTNTMDQNKSGNRMESKIPLKNHYGPAKKKKENGGEQRQKKAYRLIPQTLLT